VPAMRHGFRSDRGQGSGGHRVDSRRLAARPIKKFLVFRDGMPENNENILRISLNILDHLINYTI
jgi:hypothetical protein